MYLVLGKRGGKFKGAVCGDVTETGEETGDDSGNLEVKKSLKWAAHLASFDPAREKTRRVLFI